MLLAGIFLSATQAWSAELSARFERERYYDGGTVRVHVMLSSASHREPLRAQAVWTVMDQDLARETKLLVPGTDEVFDIKAPAPLRAPSPLSFRISLSTSDGGAGDISEAAQAVMFPEEPKYFWEERLIKKRVGIYDPKNILAPELERLAIQTIKIKNLDAVVSNMDAVILAPRSMEFEGAELLSRLEPKVERGLPVLLLEPGPLPRQFPLDIAIEAQDTQAASLVWKGLALPREAQHHPGLWGAGVNAGSYVILNSTRTPSETLLGIEGEPPPGLSISLAAFFPVGKGGYVISQLDCAEKLGEEPLALWAMMQFLRGSIEGWPRRQR